MRVIDPGHVYELQTYDGDGDGRLTFVKREGRLYPGNHGSHPGTNCQEVIRALIDRVKYLDQQIACDENKAIIDHLRSAIRLFEERAGKRHNRLLPPLSEQIETMNVSPVDGHLLPSAPSTEDET